jgi:hypothetical protein
VIDAAPSTNSTVSLLVGLDTGVVGSRTAFSPTTRGESSARFDAGGLADAGLLVLDEAWSELDSDDTDEGELAARWTDDEHLLEDSALAAVFEDAAKWWNPL